MSNSPRLDVLKYKNFEYLEVKTTYSTTMDSISIDSEYLNVQELNNLFNNLLVHCNVDSLDAYKGYSTNVKCYQDYGEFPLYTFETASGDSVDVFLLDATVYISFSEDSWEITQLNNAKLAVFVY
jgi:hypothetical protein